MSIFATVGAWGQTVGNTSISLVLVAAYVAVFFGIMIFYGIRNARRRIKDIEDYVRDNKSGAVQRLSRDDFLKAMEKDTEYMSETSRFMRAQFKNTFLVLGVVIALLTAYPFLFSKAFYDAASYLESHFPSAGLGSWFCSILGVLDKCDQFYTHLAVYLIYFGFFFIVMLIITRAMRAPFLTTNIQIRDLPYIVSREFVIYKDAIIIDNMYLLRAPIEVNRVVINEKRRFVEFELVKQLPYLPYTKVRVYTKSPRELWEKMGRLFKVNQTS